MGIPNCVMVVYNDLPRPPFYQYALALSPLKQVVWSVIGDSSSIRNDQESDLEEVLSLAERVPNISGTIMDDFFHRGKARYPLEKMSQLCDRLHGAARPLDLWVVVQLTVLNVKEFPVRSGYPGTHSRGTMHSVFLQEVFDVFTMIEVMFALQHLASLKIQGIEEHAGVQVCILTGGEHNPAILNQHRSMHRKH